MASLLTAYLNIFTGRNEVVAKVMFLKACVCPQGGGRVSASVHALVPPSQNRHTTTPLGPGRPPRDQADGRPPLGPGRPPHRPSRHPPPGPGRPPRDQADGRPPLGPGRPPHRPSRHPPRTRQTPPDQADPPTKQTPPGPGRNPRDQAEPPPPPEADSSRRSMSGRYASYWNAFLY